MQNICNGKSCFLAQLQPLSDDQDCCICYEHVILPFTTPCGHTFCRKCLHQWTVDAPTCPTCRTILYLLPDAEDYLSAAHDDDGLDDFVVSDREAGYESDSTDGEDGERINGATARRLAADTGLITTTFATNHDKIIDHLTELYQRNDRNLDYNPVESDELVKLNYQSQIDACIATLLYLKPHRGDAHTLRDVCHRDWEKIAEIFHNVLRREDGEVMEARELYWELFDEVADYELIPEFSEYSQDVMRAHSARGGDCFGGDFYEFTARVVKIARDAYLESVEDDEFGLYMQAFQNWVV
ncbi:hypothetical protein CLAFUW4_14031 [Fulvia fulva]|uniref:RING-type domain-containing protein n=1 Tax=Passalora fulva TaxID=5499 RepID=A0A9Q8PKN6_PASFU|nr:uncharacterized protein CLAFUR5_13870 [Fulvia fulva]KAK4610246.1 hypothetical protein CLAFUR4_14034 [Fulvia fulva]KAK4610781.1 hypothetical protein CLAFUR0_14038 [Fulvia fulva]UJO24196.1 hypothetical protein CLAFUR5_13870 [Fulvia fulva]WPV21783.1 hypothetical protein CLAFUW4_14031 [Fulvia fulva]WPV36943.1 hypothetical protein CLAFUW7_14042 [Fulvia fulva]